MRFQVKGAGEGWGGGGIRYPCPPFGSRKVDSLPWVDTETQCTFSEDVEMKKQKNAGGGRKRHREVWRKQQRERFRESMTKGTLQQADKERVKCWCRQV